IGAGPAGLTAAYYLAKKGYKVIVFEALPTAGGMMVAGIPEYRLPRDIVQSEIDAITALGVEIKTNVRVGKDVSINSLRDNGYQAILFTIGAFKGRKLMISGEDKYTGCVDSIKFLTKVNYGERTKPGDRVVVIGGGNSAIDAARVAVRLGAANVTIAYRRTRKEMPAFEEEIEAAEEEGVIIEYLTAPTRLVGKNEKLTGLECIRNKMGEPDSSGRRRPVPVEGSGFILECDVLIPAISQEPDIEELANTEDFEITKWNTFKVDPDNLETNIKGVFAAGDAVTGPSTIIEAIAAGQRSAAAIDKHFEGEKLEWEYRSVIPKKMIAEIEVPEAEVERLKRPKMPCLKAAKRKKDFSEVETGYTEEMAVDDAKR
ncbi:MAG: FAD-dependent oxidoreductase, partial [Candidatus Aminicenantes bacterium]|nr:FAD-dependent oxidoreductase [Candidatus Aminicenantes bacterium]